MPTPNSTRKNGDGHLQRDDSDPGVILHLNTDHHFPCTRRLRKRWEFLRVQNRGYRIHGRRFIFHFMEGLGSRHRLGVTVSKKVGNAVRRNQVKRWVRDIYRQMPAFGADGDGHGPRWDLVVTAKQGVEDFDHSVIRDEMYYVINRFLENPSAARRSKRRGRPSRKRR